MDDSRRSFIINRVVDGGSRWLFIDERRLSSINNVVDDGGTWLLIDSRRLSIINVVVDSGVGGITWPLIEPIVKMLNPHNE